jgi:hypothetical protein
MKEQGPQRATPRARAAPATQYAASRVARIDRTVARQSSGIAVPVLRPLSDTVCGPSASLEGPWLSPVPRLAIEPLDREPRFHRLNSGDGPSWRNPRFPDVVCRSHAALQHLKRVAPAQVELVARSEVASTLAVVGLSRHDRSGLERLCWQDDDVAPSPGPTTTEVEVVTVVKRGENGRR